MAKKWWQEAVVYEIYCKSFCDSNGDGIGDLGGVMRKLPVLKELGINCIWFTPIYKSPQVDNGYDVADYYDIDPAYGTLDDFKKLLDMAHGMGIRVIMDQVLNHSSDECMWFQESRKSKDNPYRDFYIWQPPKADGSEPNNWGNRFREGNGSAWTFDELTGEYYLHQYSAKMPDLNWEYQPLRQEIYKMLRFWLDLGVDGFREDVITFISKKEGLPDDHIMPASKGMTHYNHGPHIHEYLTEFKQDVLDHYDCFTIAEAPLVSPKKALDYIDEENGQLDMMIQFQCVAADCFLSDYYPLKFNLKKMKKAFSSWQYQMKDKAWNSLYIENHDHPRILSRYGNEFFWKESGKMLAAMYLFQQGTPFIYQGQEIGMINWRPDSIDEYRDVQTIWNYNHKALNKSPEERLKRQWRSARDSARTPVQWSAEQNAGFPTAETPWINVNSNYTWLNAAQQEEDPDSILNFYREAVKLRKSLSCVRHGEYKEYFPLSDKFYMYSMADEKQKILVVCSFSDKDIKIPTPAGFDLKEAKLILANYTAPTRGKFRPYECKVYLWK